MKKLFIMTLTWNGESKLKSLAPGLLKSLDSLELTYEWHVRDNGSKDNSVEFLKTLPNTIIYEVGHNRDNFSQGMNYLFNEAKPDNDDLVLLLNNDIVFGDIVSLDKMIKLQEKTTSDIVGARLLYRDSDLLQHAGVIFGSRYGGMPYHLYHKEPTTTTAQANRYFQSVTAAVMLVTAKAFKTVGGFNEKFNWAFDDTDLTLRIGKIKSKNIAYCGETLIYHEESASLKKNPVNKMWIESNVKLFKSNHMGQYEMDHEKYLNDKNYMIIL